VTLADLLEAEGPGDRSPAICRVSIVRAQLSPEDRAALDRVLADQRWTAARIAEVLGRYGYEMSAESMRRHRRGDCRCSKTS
jgi:IS30 family transposase